MYGFVRTTLGMRFLLVSLLLTMFSSSSDAFTSTINHREAISLYSHNRNTPCFLRNKFYMSSSNNDFDIDDGDDEDDMDYFNSLTQLEKKQMAKEFFAKVLNYDDEEMRPEFVHIILFNVGTNREGAHTIEFPMDSGNNVMLAFEDESDCEEFIEELKEQDFFDPVLRKINLDNLEAYCNEIKVEVQVVPEGSNMKPPNERVLNLGLNPDLEKEMKLLESLFQMESDDDFNGAFE